MKKKIQFICLSCLLIILITSCSFQTVNENSSNNYYQTSSLDILIDIPVNIEKDNEVTINLSFTKDGKTIKKLDNLVVQLWVHGPEYQLPLIVENRPEGFYQLKTTFTHDGLYFIKINARHDNSIIMPMKQFVVGDYDYSNLDVDDMYEGSQNDEHESHH